MPKPKKKSAVPPSDFRLIKWTRTNDALGFKPNFTVVCDNCNLVMQLRRSELTMPTRNAKFYPRVVGAFTNLYKCPECELVKFFCITHPYLDNEYFAKVLEWRDNCPDWIPPRPTWEEDERIRKKLKDLGYW